MRLFAIIFAISVIFGGSVQAEPVRLLELFVSKNCPACPAAQQNLVDLEDTEGPFIPLIWVVDYWDYVDTPDPMAIAESSKRQRQYAEALGIRGPYTPQLVVNGSNHVAGNKMPEVEALLSRQKSSYIPVSEGGIGLTVDASSVQLDGALSGDPLELWILDVVTMDRYGLRQPNAVTDVTGPFEWSGGTADFEYTCTKRCVAIVQEAGRGAVKAAAVFDTESTGSEG